jgi:hypothetical protein
MTTKNVTIGDAAWFLFKIAIGMLAVLASFGVALAILPTILVLK